MKFRTLHQIFNRLQSRDQKLKFLKFKMAAAAILKIAFLAKSATNCPISEILYEEAERQVDKGYGTKCKCVKSEMVDCRHFENR